MYVYVPMYPHIYVCTTLIDLSLGLTRKRDGILITYHQLEKKKNANRKGKPLVNTHTCTNISMWTFGQFLIRHLSHAARVAWNGGSGKQQARRVGSSVTC